MAANNITIDTETSAGTMEALLAGINARSEKLGKTTEDSSVAAAITILRSLKAPTKKAKVKFDDSMVKVVDTGLVGGLRKVGGEWKVYCHPRGDKHPSHIRPAIGYTPGTPGAVFRSRVFKVVPVNQNAKFSKSINAPTEGWYVLCETEGQARRYGEGSIAARRGMLWMIKKESGMARAALAMAQAKASTKSRVITRKEFAEKGTMSARASGLAYEAGSLTVNSGGNGSGSTSVSFYDNLRYSSPAAGGSSALDKAIAKAENSLLGAYGSPEIRAVLEDMKTTDPEAKFVDIFRRKFSA